TTIAGGANNVGSVFRLTPAGTLTLLASLSSTTGSSPYGALALGSDGNFYAATVFGGANNQGAILKVDGPPPAPTGLTATPGVSYVQLSWNPTPHATSYNVYKSTTAGNANPTLVQSGITGTLYSVTSGLINDTTYYFTVRAVNN